MIEMHIAGIGLDARSGQPIILLDDEAKQRVLPIWISVAEFIVLARTLENNKPDRPMTHDLMLNIIEQAGYFVEQVEMTEVEAETYQTKIKLAEKAAPSSSEKYIEARPSDAIAIAIKSGAPIYVDSQIVTGAVITTNQDEAQETQQFHDFVKELKASDFNAYL